MKAFFPHDHFPATEGVLHNMSVPPKTEVWMELRAVHGATSISLPRCLLLKGLIARGDSSLCQSCRTFFQGDTDARVVLVRSGFSQDTIEIANRAFGGMLIGWLPTRDIGVVHAPSGAPKKPIPGTYDDPPVCEDLALTLAILSRRIGNLYLSHRSPCFSVPHLLESDFVVDDPRVAARCQERSWKAQEDSLVTGLTLS